MKPRITFLTLGVDDLERSVRFYRDGLGLPTKGIIGTEYEHGAVAFFELAGGMRLAVWPRENLAHDTGMPRTAPCPGDFSIAHNVTKESEVDEVMREAEAAGAHIVKPAQHNFWGGYTGYFQDPDGHLWEVAFNPEIIPSD